MQPGKIDDIQIVKSDRYQSIKSYISPCKINIYGIGCSVKNAFSL